MPEEKKPEHIYERKVHYYETDKMGIVHHSNYIRWFEEARVDYMEKRGFSYQRMESAGVMIPVLSVECQYKLPARFGQTVLIHARIEEFKGTRLNVSYEITDKETGELLATGRTAHCFVDAISFRPIRPEKTDPQMAQIFRN